MAGLPEAANSKSVPPTGNPSQAHSTKADRAKVNLSKDVWLRFSSLCRLEGDRWPVLHRRVFNLGATGLFVSQVGIRKVLQMLRLQTSIVSQDEKVRRQIR